MAQQGSLSSKRTVVGRVLDGWSDVRNAQQQLALKNHPWLVGASIHHQRRFDA